MTYLPLAILFTVIVYFAIAFGLLLSQGPVPLDDTKTISFPLPSGKAPDEVAEQVSFAARDGAHLNLRRYSAKIENAPLVILIHGSGWHGGGYSDIAQSLAATGQFEILLPDLRGHGPTAQNRGDVAYIGQLEDDLADLIGKYQKTGQKIFLIGHSSGGGLVIRFAGSKYGKMVNKAVLMAPFLKYNAPTIREDSGGWAHPLTRRIIGLNMLNSLGITQFNGMTAIQFNFPKSILEGPMGHSATQSYSFRLLTSFAPRSEYLTDVAALPNFLLIAGEEDDSFIANQYEPTLKAVTERGRYEILPDVNHIGLVTNDRAKKIISNFLME